MDVYNNYLKIIVDELKNNSTTTDDELKRYCKNAFGEKFKGVYPLDKIPKKIKNGQTLIFNLDKSNQSGSHWMALFKINNKNYVYDSFGRKSKELNVPLKTIDAEYDAEQKMEQSNCGQRCIAWIACCYTISLEKCLSI